MRGFPWIILLAAALVSISGCRARVSPSGAGGTGAPRDSGHSGSGTGGLIGSGGVNNAGAGAGGSGGATLVYDRSLYGDGPGPRALYVDGNDLIWAEIAPQGPIVMRGPKNGSGPVTTLGTWLDGDRTLRLFAADTEAIYWLRAWQIHRVRKTGEPLPPLEMGAGHLSGGLISDGDVLYVAEPTCKWIGWVPKDGRPPTYIASPLFDTPGGVTDIAADDTHVYCADGPYIHALPKLGHSIETLISDQEAAGALAVSSDFIFWVNNRRILGTKQENLAFTSKRPPRSATAAGTVGVGVASIAFDATRHTVYGSGSGSALNRIFSYNADTGRFTVMMDNTPIFGGFAHDETYVYWVSDTKIWRLPKDSIVPPAR